MGEDKSAIYIDMAHPNSINARSGSHTHGSLRSIVII